MTADRASASVGADEPPDADDRYARAALSYLVEPGDLVLGWLLRAARPAQVLAVVMSGCRNPGSVLWPGTEPGEHPVTSPAAADRAISRWRDRLPDVPPAARLAAWERHGYRLVCPGEPEWPTQLDDLGAARPVLLWLHGAADLRFACLRSVSLVGSRAATAYGVHIGTEMGADLAGRGWTVVSGGAYGIDACAHRGALVASGPTVAVLASGLRFG